MSACGAADQKSQSNNPIVTFRCFVNADLKYSLAKVGVKNIRDNDFVEIKAELYLDKMPYTVSNFINLCNKKFYDGIHFHRIIDGFMIQFGCPYAKKPQSKIAGQGNPKPFSKFKILSGRNKGKKADRNATGCITDELTQKISNKEFTLSMANTGEKNTGGSQFFINTQDNSFLDWFNEQTNSNHPVFGKILPDSESYIRMIEKVQTDKSDRPVYPLKMKNARVSMRT